MFVELDPDEVVVLQRTLAQVMRNDDQADPIFEFATGGVIDLRTLKGVMPFVPSEYAENLAMEEHFPEMEEQQLRLAMAIANAAQRAVREHGTITSMGMVDCDHMVLTKYIHEALHPSLDDEDDDPDPGDYS